jgi:hypothetical protein
MNQACRFVPAALALLLMSCWAGGVLYGAPVPRPRTVPDENKARPVPDDPDEALLAHLRDNHYAQFGGGACYLWVKGLDGNRLTAPTFKRRNRECQTDVVLTGREAWVHVDRTKGVVFITMRKGEASLADGSVVVFEERTWQVPLPDEPRRE